MIRTTSDLIDRIAQDLIWRRKELTDLKALIHESEGEIRSRVVIRAAVALLYAHWEGFVKKASSYYLEFVASHRLPYAQLAPNFVGIKLRTMFNTLGASNKISAGNEIADFFCTNINQQSNIPYKSAVDTKSNLSSTVLLDILEALGLDKAPFATRLAFIDTNLVNPRNHIAHGEDVGLTMDEYLELHTAVIALIETYRNEVENSSVLRRYARV
ncbi:MAE_28990/MAE_18760 family HEPN-like nuclease [Roseateles sp. LKC17W]|uniref:MAE_28990/MAE_18760 family HEPN-like nuclease n=1 Tax=Pelomonas margarita TaxID=3299031 RepID=A0ABW7FJC5_9BURK